MRNAHRPATLEPVRFGEFLRDRHLITDEQWLAALAEHWSDRVSRTARRVRIGQQIADAGFLEQATIEAEARAFHDGAGLDIVEIDDANRPRSERTTLPVPNVRFVAPQI